MNSIDTLRALTLMATSHLEDDPGSTSAFQALREELVNARAFIREKTDTKWQWLRAATIDDVESVRLLLDNFVRTCTCTRAETFVATGNHIAGTGCPKVIERVYFTALSLMRVHTAAFLRLESWICDGRLRLQGISNRAPSRGSADIYDGNLGGLRLVVKGYPRSRRRPTITPDAHAARAVDRVGSVLVNVRGEAAWIGIQVDRNSLIQCLQESAWRPPVLASGDGALLRDRIEVVAAQRQSQPPDVEKRAENEDPASQLESAGGTGRGTRRIPAKGRGPDPTADKRLREQHRALSEGVVWIKKNYGELSLREKAEKLARMSKYNPKDWKFDTIRVALSGKYPPFVNAGLAAPGLDIDIQRT